MLEDNPLLSRIVSRFHIIVASVVALAGAAVFGIAAGSGDFYNIYVGLFVCGFISIMLALGEKYWLVIPFAFTAELPAIPIKGRMLDLPEIVAVLATLVFLIRYAVKRQTFTLFRTEHAPFLLFTGWAVLIFILNPVGLSDAGAALGGARFYAKILLALAAFIVMANQEISDQDCKWIFILLLVGAFLESAYKIAAYFQLFGMTTDISSAPDPDDFYSWHQALAHVPILLISLGFARYRASELFSLNRLWAVFLFGICVITVALSGKRAALASIPIIAIVAAVMRREWAFLMFWLSGAIIAGGIVVIGHGELFHLPLTVQRAMSALPARWDSELGYMEGGQDLFRAELRRMAIKKIEKDPWVGTGYQVDLSLAQTLALQYASRGGDTELQVTPFAMGSAWHNTWLGYAADFGIPASVCAAFIYFFVLKLSYRTTLALPRGSMRATLTSYFFLTTFTALLRSYTSGHSAEDAFGRWWSYGALISLWLSYNRSAASKASDITSPSVGGLGGFAGASLPAAPFSSARPRDTRGGTLVGGSSRR